MRKPPVRYRTRAVPADVPALRRLVASTRVFDRAERAIALELLEERLARGAKSGYSFVFAERDGELLGYAAWGHDPLTRRSFDLYWIVIAPAAQGQGLGQALLELVERAIAGRGGGNLYVETSSRKVYARSRRFYQSAGYRRVARLRDFYAPGDHKMLFCKVIRTRK
ncbi:MAG TPA: GNAT family N-acetyltransferase [Gammaproteobacteria bacterium]|nr:GNAT family N-acetyltransferase [Gammaproteobacteria bacterium]